ncbi:hypothetical protein K491DRAFT_674095 [Lophiostoma macrostomum CBS 122681]|uniref:Uncharacterized protein n=1 Tax=Lophiostoma macrostomum CBS 122681 TaxID=1314788 RepID=A0A6A6TNQ3_9PLEO|nr:hypothetical protein K491DRAFT_674095 [Lophiostoma macrostomum CBS 122681]
MRTQTQSNGCIWQSRLVKNKELQEYEVGHIRDAWDYYEFQSWAHPTEWLDARSREWIGLSERPQEDLSSKFELSRVCKHPLHPAQKPGDYCPACEVHIGFVFLDLLTAAGFRNRANFAWSPFDRSSFETFELREEWRRARLHIAQTVFKVEGLIPQEREWELENIQLDLDMKRVHSATIAVQIAKENTKYLAACMNLEEFERFYGGHMDVDTDKKSLSFAPDTNFGPGRDVAEFDRSAFNKHNYKPGRYSALPGTCLEQTSFLRCQFYNVNQFKVYSVFSQAEFESYRKSPELLPEVHEGVLAGHRLFSVLCEELDSLMQVPESKQNLYKQCGEGDALVALVDAEWNLLDYEIVKTPDLERSWRPEGLVDGWACARDFTSC